MAFANHLHKASPNVVQFGTTSSKYLCVEGQSDKNVIARLLPCKDNNLIITNVMGDTSKVEFWNPSIDDIDHAKERVKHSCKYLRVHGLIDRDDPRYVQVPEKCYVTDHWDLEATMFHEGGIEYVSKLLAGLVATRKDVPAPIVSSFYSNLLDLASELNRLLISNVFRTSFIGKNGQPKVRNDYGSICTRLDTLTGQAPQNANIPVIINRVLEAYGKSTTMDIRPGRYEIGDINGHLTVTAFAILVKNHPTLSDYLNEEQIGDDWQRLSLQVIKRQIENEIERYTTPPLNKTRMFKQLISGLSLTMK